MPVRSKLPLIPLVVTLALAACNQAPPTTDNALVNVENAAEFNDTAFNEEEPVVEDLDSAAAAPAVEVAAVPLPPSDATPADRAERDEASEIETGIRRGREIERVRYHDGWAWMRNGQIIRTADRDGRNVAYFRPGTSVPFFVQREGRSYLYRDGRPVRVFGSDGRARDPDADRRREAEDAARTAADRRRDAVDARRRANEHGRHGPPPIATPAPSPTPTPTPSPSHSPTHRGPDRRGDWPGMRPGATPSPDATPGWRNPDRRPDRRPDRGPDRTGNP